ncbi:MAG TPA: type II secretion system F family protein [Micromonosporaceae bacterium]
MLSWELPIAVIGGGLAGTGLFLIVRELLPATPSLGPALARLQPAGAGAPGSGAAMPAARTPEDALGSWGFLARYVTVPAKDLAILGKGTDAYLTSLGVSFIVGLVGPAALSVLLILAGVHIHVVIPFAVGPVIGLLAAFVAHRDVLTKAAVARREFTRAFCTYLDLVGLELSAAGPVQALESASKICHGWVFERIAGALTQAQMQMTFPWEQLRLLSEEIGVTDLHDFAAIMRSAGDSGAHVQDTLHEQAEAQRDKQRTDALARAESISARLEMPAAMLVIVLAGFMIYPLMARLT